MSRLPEPHSDGLLAQNGCVGASQNLQSSRQSSAATCISSALWREHVLLPPPLHVFLQDGKATCLDIFSCEEQTCLFLGWVLICLLLAPVTAECDGDVLKRFGSRQVATGCSSGPLSCMAVQSLAASWSVQLICVWLLCCVFFFFKVFFLIVFNNSWSMLCFLLKTTCYYLSAGLIIHRTWCKKCSCVCSSLGASRRCSCLVWLTQHFLFKPKLVQSSLPRGGRRS